tara:strand:+ start:432 stop:560 length:129 start_codon:yes stop_codon:yes gene_type:complete
MQYIFSNFIKKYLKYFLSVECTTRALYSMQPQTPALNCGAQM